MSGIDGASSSPQGSPAWRWPAIVIGLLVAHVMLMLAVAAIAMRDNSSVVLPNYYRNAINWDKIQAERRASEKLGWKIQIEPAAQVDPTGKRAISFRLTDSTGQPISGAQLHVTYYHHAHAGQLQNVTFAAEPYQAALPMRYAGLWQFDIRAEAHSQTFIASVTQEVTNQR